MGDGQRREWHDLTGYVKQSIELKKYFILSGGTYAKTIIEERKWNNSTKNPSNQ